MDQFNLYVKQKQDSLEYKFTGLILATLALSVQFGSTVGGAHKFLLIASWITFLISGIISCWRISQSVSHDGINLHKNKLETLVASRVKILSDPSMLSAVRNGQAIDDVNHKIMTEKAIKEAMENEKNLISTAKKNMEKMRKNFPFWFKLQISSYLLGILLYGTYSSFALYK